MNKPCYFVFFSSSHEASDAYVFQSEAQAKQDIREDAETEFAELKKEGWNPVFLEYSDTHLEVYIPDTNIYFEWTIEQSAAE